MDQQENGQAQVNEIAFQMLKDLLDDKTTPDELKATQGDQSQESIYGQAIKDALDAYNY